MFQENLDRRFDRKKYENNYYTQKQDLELLTISII